MKSAYDVCVDYETLCTIETKLQYISHDLEKSTEQMMEAIRNSENFLSGNQFDKAKNTTRICLDLTKRTSGNINHAMEYISALKSALEEYGKCAYKG